MASTKTQDLDYNDREQALEIIKRFKKKYLHDNIEELINQLKSLPGRKSPKLRNTAC